MVGSDAVGMVAQVRHLVASGHVLIILILGVNKGNGAEVKVVAVLIAADFDDWVAVFVRSVGKREQAAGDNRERH